MTAGAEDADKLDILVNGISTLNTRLDDLEAVIDDLAALVMEALEKPR
jgi:outer membrane murein-binding lipoprotein Lpp